eukprot:365961-Chlamydomonas_euryale.AAC.2
MGRKRGRWDESGRVWSTLSRGWSSGVAHPACIAHTVNPPGASGTDVTAQRCSRHAIAHSLRPSTAERLHCPSATAAGVSQDAAGSPSAAPASARRCGHVCIASLVMPRGMRKYRAFRSGTRGVRKVHTISGMIEQS